MKKSELIAVFNGDRVTLKRKCPFCGRESVVDMLASEFIEGMKKRDDGALIQDAFPPDKFSGSFREMLMTGICDNCFQSI